MRSHSTWAAWSIVVLLVLLSPVIVLLLALVVEIMIVSVVDLGAPALVVLGAGAGGRLLFRALRVSRRVASGET